MDGKKGWLAAFPVSRMTLCMYPFEMAMASASSQANIYRSFGHGGCYEVLF